MRSLLLLILISAVIGLVLGAALGYYEARPWAVIELDQIETKPIKKSAAEENQVKFEIPEKIFNFGKMERGTTMTHAFKVINTGETPLSIEVTGSTCKCTVGELEQSKLAPGEETDVMLEWTAKTKVGPFRHGARLAISPGSSEVELTVEGEVMESTSVYPGELIFGDVSVGETARAELFLLSNLQEDVQVTGHEFSDPALADQIEVEFLSADPSELPVPSAAGAVKVKATYQADQKIGRFRGWLELTTNLESSPKRTLFFAGNKIGDISIFGPGWSEQRGLLNMGAVRSDKGKTSRLILSVRGDAAKSSVFEIASVVPPQLKATLGERKSLNDQLMHAPLLLELPAGTPSMARVGEPASSDAVVLLKTNHPKVSEVQIRVHFRVEE